MQMILCTVYLTIRTYHYLQVQDIYIIQSTILSVIASKVDHPPVVNWGEGEV